MKGYDLLRKRVLLFWFCTRLDLDRLSYFLLPIIFQSLVYPSECYLPSFAYPTDWFCLLLRPQSGSETESRQLFVVDLGNLSCTCNCIVITAILLSLHFLIDISQLLWSSINSGSKFMLWLTLSDNRAHYMSESVFEWNYAKLQLRLVYRRRFLCFVRTKDETTVTNWSIPFFCWQQPCNESGSYSCNLYSQNGLLYFQCGNTMAAAAAAALVASIAAGGRAANGGMISVLTGDEL